MTPPVTAQPDGAAGTRDVLGWRCKFGVLAPSTNTVVEPDFYTMAVPGVTAHVARIHIRDGDIGDDAGMHRLLAQIRTETQGAIQRVRSAEPDYIVMGMSAETFWGGLAGHQEFMASMQAIAGCGVASGAAAVNRGLSMLGARRIAVLTPYQPVGDENVRLFFEQSGYDVVTVQGLRCPTAVSIAHVPESRLRQELVALAAQKPDAIVQCGTNLSMVALADEAERWLGLPVLAINAATWWMALRENGIEDRIHRCGRLLRDF